jgi:hypothetical protein
VGQPHVLRLQLFVFRTQMLLNFCMSPALAIRQHLPTR